MLVAVVGSGVGAVVSGLLSVFIMRLPILVLTVGFAVLVVVVGMVLLIRRPGIKLKTRWAFVIPLVIVAAGLGVAIGRVTASRAASSPNGHPTFLRIASPAATVSCPTQSQCRFQVSGKTAAGLSSDLEIIVLVFPVTPSGGGWYIQWPPASIGPDGDWLQSPTDIGSAAAPAHGGDTLQIEAILVHADSTYKGTALADLSKSGTPIPDFRQITGLVIQSEPIPITIKKP